MKDELIPDETIEDLVVEPGIRPDGFSDFVGQESLKENLRVYIQAARNRSEALDHVLLSGPPGLGKTTLSHILANELGVGIKATSGPVIERQGDLAAILTNLEEREILFIDEVHRLPRVVEEVLYSAMEDYKLDIVIGQGPSARSIKLDLPRFTLVGATTRTGLLTSPLRDRFGVVDRLNFYAPVELQKIIKRSAGILEVPISDEGAVEVARRSRGTPRIANRLVRRLRDFAQVKGTGIIDLDLAKTALAAMKVDEEGLDEMDHNLLLTIIEKFDGGPVGLETLAASLREEKDSIEDVYEPYLLQKGFIERTPRGRIATCAAYEHLGFKQKKQKLF